MSDVLEQLRDLHNQATTERSHYYTAKMIAAAMAEIMLLREIIVRLQRGGQ